MPAPQTDTPGQADAPKKSLSVFRRRWRKFRTLKRGWYSFVAILVLYFLSLCCPVLVNSRALIVKHNGEYSFPALSGFREARDFGQRIIGEADYRLLKQQFDESRGDDFVLLTPYPYHPNESLLDDALLPGRPPHAPTAEHWLGTDNRGRDVFARLVYGFQISVTFALGVVLLSYIVGMIVGQILGYFGGRVDMYGQRFVEIWSGLPFLYTVIIISNMVTPSVTVLILILATFRWMGTSFYMRGEFYREKSRDYVAAAIAQGDSHASIMFRHILPNSLTPIISFAPFALVAAISSLVSLDFLGFGLPAPTPSWGEMVNQGLENIHKWHLVVFPLSALFLTLMMVVFIGEAIREAFDPKVFSRLR
ncbi:MAG: ABC transporter permease subunit [bacterium]|nr:ABC transporter permease subunit [Planctomycetota bacterium]HIL51054.1 ABC transporter permease subunit [Planctomycetota bacterium]